MGYIYKIINTINQKAYIGISINNPKDRIQRHLSGKGNKLIAQALKKYGYNSFTYKILEQNIFPELLVTLETSYIKTHNTITPNGYNLTPGGDGYATKEKREKISKGNKGKSSPLKGIPRPEKVRKKISQGNKGKIVSEKSRQKMSQSHKGKVPNNKGIPVSPERKLKISKTLKEFYKSNPTMKEKLCKRRKGKKHTLETRQKMSKSHKGKHTGKRKPHTLEHRQKISQALIGRKGTRKHSDDYYTVHKIYLSLPTKMLMRDKRKILYQKYPHRSKRTIRSWTLKWSKKN